MNAIEVKNLSKKYYIRKQREKNLTLCDKLFFSKNKILSLFNKTLKDEFWSLKNINFNIKKGEVIGIIGKNGAGKSTLLKILSGIVSPTEGKIKIYGQVSSLLEIGTGFHPELTGEENIYLNSAILGMTKREIDKKINKIVEFSQIGKFLNTPVKHYSSGMYVRLAFAIAIHVNSDILMIDEILAVGDINFQKKCFKKMREVTESNQKTILFISHNMNYIKNLCNKCIYIEKGEIKKYGDPKEAINLYTKINHKNIIPLAERRDRNGAGEIKFTEVKVLNQNNFEKIYSGDKIKIILKYKSIFNSVIKNVRIVLTVVNELDEKVLRFDSIFTKNSISEIKPKGEIICYSDKINLIEGLYKLNINIITGILTQDHIIEAYYFKIINNLDRYDFLMNPEKNICSNILKYNFEQR